MLLSSLNSIDECFLCAPDPSLVYAYSTSATALCGLGPLLPGYSVIGARKHVASCADAASNSPEFLQFTEMVRKVLTDNFGSCMLSEHGRLPVCAPLTGAHEHCFHAHFLLFPGAPNVTQKAKTFFAKLTAVATLSDAMNIAHSADEYFLLSPTPESYFVMTRPGKLIRQFARLLVAEAVGQPERANWMRYPEKAAAQACAQDLRKLLPRASNG